MVGESECAKTFYDLGVTIDLGSARIFSTAIYEAYLFCYKDIWIAANDYCIPGQKFGMLRIQYGHAAATAEISFRTR